MGIFKIDFFSSKSVNKIILCVWGIANIGTPLEFWVYVDLWIFLVEFLVFANKPTVQSGGVSGGRSVAVTVAASDR